MVHFTKRHVLFLAGVLLLGFSACWHFLLAPRWTQRLPPGWKWQATFLGGNANPDPKTGQFPGKDFLCLYEREVKITDDSKRPDEVLVEDRRASEGFGFPSLARRACGAGPLTSRRRRQGGAPPKPGPTSPTRERGGRQTPRWGATNPSLARRACGVGLVGPASGLWKDKSATKERVNLNQSLA